jgi:hypothetical protein
VKKNGFGIFLVGGLLNTDPISIVVKELWWYSFLELDLCLIFFHEI